LKELAMHPWYQFSMSPWELLTRGTIMYWFLLLLFRFVLRRDAGSAGITDILFVVLLGDAAQNGMIGQADTVPDALALISVLAGWNYLLDLLGYHVPLVARLTDPPPLVLVRNGRVLARNLRREHVTRDELLAAMREEGVESYAEIKYLRLESNGSFSVIKRKTR
jgi:uncharacterized membrane protein YcaP (DUF421 family)